MYKIKRYFAGVYKQAKKVRWPTKKEMLVAVGVVLLFVTISALALALDDFLITKILALLDKAMSSNKPVDSSASAAGAVNVIGKISGNIGRMFK